MGSHPSSKTTLLWHLDIREMDAPRIPVLLGSNVPWLITMRQIQSVQFILGNFCRKKNRKCISTVVTSVSQRFQTYLFAFAAHSVGKTNRRKRRPLEDIQKVRACIFCWIIFWKTCPSLSLLLLFFANEKQHSRWRTKVDVNLPDCANHFSEGLAHICHTDSDSSYSTK